MYDIRDITGNIIQDLSSVAENPFSEKYSDGKSFDFYGRYGGYGGQIGYINAGQSYDSGSDSVSITPSFLSRIHMCSMDVSTGGYFLDHVNYVIDLSSCGNTSSNVTPLVCVSGFDGYGESNGTYHIIPFDSNRRVVRMSIARGTSYMSDTIYVTSGSIVSVLYDGSEWSHVISYFGKLSSGTSCYDSNSYESVKIFGTENVFLTKGVSSDSVILFENQKLTIKSFVYGSLRRSYYSTSDRMLGSGILTVKCINSNTGYISSAIYLSTSISSGTYSSRIGMKGTSSECVNLYRI